jgi:hypothetical protein
MYVYGYKTSLAQWKSQKGKCKRSRKTEEIMAEN